MPQDPPRQGDLASPPRASQWSVELRGWALGKATFLLCNLGKSLKLSGPQFPGNDNTSLLDNC